MRLLGLRGGLAVFFLAALALAGVAEEPAAPAPAAGTASPTAAGSDQNAGTAANPYPAESGNTVATVANPFPVKPYSDDEFPEWLRIVRRFEIIAIGSFPIAYLNANILYDVGRFGALAFQYEVLKTPDSQWGDSSSANYYLQYAPLFFAPSNKPSNTDKENLGVVLSSIGLSLGIAVIDLIIGLVEEDQKKKQEAGAAP